MLHETTSNTADDATNDGLTGREMMQNVRQEATDKARDMMIKPAEATNTTKDEDPYFEFNNSPAFDPTKFWGKKRPSATRAAKKAWSILHASGETIINPKKSLKSRATKTTASKIAKRQPRASRKADLQFLEAHEDLETARISRAYNEDENVQRKKDREVDDAANNIRTLQEKREAMRVAWMTRRHVTRVKAISNEKEPYPGDSYFEKADDCGATEFMWGKWIGFCLLNGSRPFTAQYIDDFEEPPFDADQLRKHIERLITVSAPLQRWISSVRHVYRWEDPALTGKWLAIYFFFFYISHVMTFTYTYMIYLVIDNYFHPSSVQEIRESIQRTMDRGSTALKVGELMDKHGSDDWLDPLLEEIGPFIQLQIGDLANLLEILYNFYHWRSPLNTCATLFLFTSCMLICLLSSAEFCLKVIYFILGVIFFGCWPVASLYPQYRLLVSPIRWAFWSIPTHAEYSFQYLQEHSRNAIDNIKAEKQSSAVANGQIPTSQPVTATEATLISNGDYGSDSSFCSATSVLEEAPVSEILHFHCIYEHKPGKLVLTPTGLHWRSSVMRNGDGSSKFYYPYTALDEMSKHHMSTNMLSPVAKLSGTEDKLVLKVRVPRKRTEQTQGLGKQHEIHTVVLENMPGRDKAFNAILGFSGLRWQNLQG